MRVLLGTRFKCGFANYSCGEGDVRIRVTHFLNLAPIQNMYFVRSFSSRMIWNYIREIGLRSVVRKIFSRHSERHRNTKFVSVGRGEIIESRSATHSVGSPVIFLACRHPRCLDEIVVPASLASADAIAAAEIAEPASIHFGAHVEMSDAQRKIVARVAGWDQESGSPVPEIEWDVVQSTLDDTQRSKTTRLALPDCPPEVRPTPPDRGHWDTTLFGYGNYAKTVIIPNLPAPLQITRIHEVDPIQIPGATNNIVWDTSPNRAAEDSNRIVLIAGYHHTHAALAVEALERGEIAVVEKPIVVDRKQLTNVLNAIDLHSGQLFACFHKRYSPLNYFTKADLRLQEGQPVSYHAIVYEVPLPDLHWYRWPNSHSSVVSNGCHWIDHFLWLNGYAEFTHYALVAAKDGTINISIELSNGAFATIALTHRGSERIGVQEYVEMRAGNCTVRVINNADYQSESSEKILRRKQLNKMLSYKEMYSRIGSGILAGDPGDSRASIDVGSRLMLELDEAYSSNARAATDSNRRTD